MNKPQIIVETPRAGKWNHRFIAAKHGTLSDGEIAKIISTARRLPQGDNYISVSVDTAQSLSGRIGKEILVLTGINIKKISEKKRQNIISQLEQRLNTDLDQLVTESIDWDKDGQTILLKRQELESWEEAFSHLPLLKMAKPKNKVTQKKWTMALIGVTVMFLGLGLFIGLQPSPPPISLKNDKAAADKAAADKAAADKAVAEQAAEKVVADKIACIQTFINHVKPETLKCENPNELSKDAFTFLKGQCGLTDLTKESQKKWSYNDDQNVIQEQQMTDLKNSFKTLKTCYGEK